ncbi:MAG TPA: integrin alpha [Planctomycetota bacterium]|nr:integrin alpha [Planctomycetota bacterium]
MAFQPCTSRLAGALCFSFALSGLASAQSAQASVLYGYSGGSGDHMGVAVAELGDVDGDHRADYAVGSVGVNNWRGQVRVFSGSRGTLLYTLDGVAPGDRFGHSLAALPDLDGDGIADFVIGAPLAQGVGGGLGAGQVYVRSGRDGSSIFVRGGDGAQDHMGWAVGSVGDVNGDGVPDFAGGAIDDDNFGISSGSVRVWSGANASGLFTVYGFKKDHLFGSSIVGMGDQDNDGNGDFAVGAPSVAGSPDAGFVRIFSGATHAVLTTINGLNSGDNFGYSIGNIGDIDSDGRADLAVGAPQVTPASTGQVDIYLAAGGPPLFREFGIGIADRFGASVAAAGDVNFDGVPDFAVGAPGADQPGLADTGSLTLFSGANGSLLKTFYGTNAGKQLGAAICGAQDFNEDGSAELVVGSPGSLAMAFETGGASVFSTTPLRFWASGFLVSASQPSTPTFTIELGPLFANMDYRVLGSITGIAPKTQVGAVQIPLVADRYFKHTFGSGLNALVPRGIGHLDSNGRAQVQFTPSFQLSSPAFYGLTFYHAALVLDAQGQPVLASNPLPVTLVP